MAGIWKGYQSFNIIYIYFLSSHIFAVFPRRIAVFLLSNLPKFYLPKEKGEEK